MKQTLVILTLLLSNLVIARETITIYYAFSAGDSVANYHRSIVAEANKIQDKYNFVFDTKPGAGGLIAANFILNNDNAIAGHSAAFFVRPNVYPKDSYDVENFRLQFVHCIPPFAITSTSIKSWKDLNKDSQSTIGISGLGATTHLVALQLKNSFPNLNIVPFKSTNDSMLSMVSGHTDLHIGFLSEAEQWMESNRSQKKTVYILGITGDKPVKNYPLMIDQGFSRNFASLTSAQHLIIPKKWKDEKVKELNDIFNKASKSEAVRKSYEIDYCQPHNIDYADLQRFFNFNIGFWKRISEGVKLD